MCDVGGRASLGCIPGRIPGTSGAQMWTIGKGTRCPMPYPFVKFFNSLASGRLPEV